MTIKEMIDRMSDDKNKDIVIADDVHVLKPGLASFFEGVYRSMPPQMAYYAVNYPLEMQLFQLFQTPEFLEKRNFDLHCNDKMCVGVDCPTCIEYRSQPDLEWTTKDCRRVPVREMHSSHLRAAIGYLQRKIDGQAWVPKPKGNHLKMVKQALHAARVVGRWRFWIETFENELKRRGL